MSQDQFAWPQGRQCAVSLTYDDALPVHYQHVAPTLSACGIRGTFFLPFHEPDVRNNPQKWREVAATGHELGNHALFHPCRRIPPESFDWLEECYNLCDYTPERLERELDIANFILHLIDGKTDRTYGNCCCDTTVGSGEAEVPMDTVLEQLFVAARGTSTSRIVDVTGPLNMMELGHFGMDGRTASQVRDDIELAAEAGGWAVFVCHGVGEGTHNLYMDRTEHDELIAWLCREQDRIWTAPFIEVARHVKPSQ